VDLRTEKEALAAKHAAEIEPITKSMETIEAWFLDQMNKMGVDNLKTPSGNPYKHVTTSVKMLDSESFKQFVFQPVVALLTGLIQQTGSHVPDVAGLLTSGILWDMIDFRVGRKGVLEHIEREGTVPPGVIVDQFTSVKIRKS